MEFLTYLCKSAGILTLFYTLYFWVLRKDTFFKANRYFLLTGMACALGLPFITLTQTTFVEMAPIAPETHLERYLPVANFQPTAHESSYSLGDFLLWTYLAVLTTLFLRFIVRLSALIHWLIKHPYTSANGFRFIQTDEKVAPFSFFNYIIFNPKLHEQKELEMILQHEEAHASQGHSLDVLAANLVQIIQWANPFSWFYRKSVSENLEFLADHQTADSVASKTDYQLTLLKASSALPVPALTNNFYQSFIKKRIIMLNKNHSNKHHQLKLLLIVPALALFLYGFNTEEVIEYTTSSSAANASESILSEKTTTSFSAQSTDRQLDALEDYFKTHHPESLIKIANRKRDAEGHLFNFSFQVKFAGDKKFVTRFDRTQELPFESTYTIEALAGKLLRVSETGPKGIQLDISPKDLKIKTQVETPSLSSSITDVSQNTSRKEPNYLGENPLYVLNGKTLRKEDLPKNKLLITEGEIETLNQAQGFQKYGEEGKDGVLVFKGDVYFASEEDSNQKSSSPVGSKTTALKLALTEFKIHKNTSDQELEKMKKELKEAHGIQLNYTTSRNNAGEIVALSMNYSGKGKNGNYQVTDDAGIEAFIFYIEENGNMGFFSEAAEARREERMKEREVEMKKRRKELQKRAEERREEMEERRVEMEVLREKRLEEMEAIREELDQKREAMREEIMIVEQDSRLSQKRFSNSNQVVLISDESGEAIRIHKNTTDRELAQMKEMMAEKHIDFNYRNVKRNAQGEITGIKISVNDHKGSKSSTVVKGDADAPIETIIIKQ